MAKEARQKRLNVGLLVDFGSYSVQTVDGGTTLGITIPTQICNNLEIDASDDLEVSLDPENDRIIMSVAVDD